MGFFARLMNSGNQAPEEKTHASEAEARPIEEAKPAGQAAGQPHFDISPAERAYLHDKRPKASKEEFEAFGVLFYPGNIANSAGGNGTPLTDDDMAFAMTCAANMEGTGYTLTPASILLLAQIRHQRDGRTRKDMRADLMYNPDPAADIRALAPGIEVDPMYPGYPLEVMQIDEAQYRFDQMLHYFSTYGVELVSELLGMNVQVARGWLPHDGEEPRPDSTRADAATGYEVLAQAKPLALVANDEAMRKIVIERIARPTRMHASEIHCAVKHLAKPGSDEPLVFGFHENMLAMALNAAQGTSTELSAMLQRTTQHPGDVLKAINYVRGAKPQGKQRLSTRQKKGFCQALSRFSYKSLVQNIVDAHPADRRALNYLSVARFGDDKLKRAVATIGRGEVKSWNAQVERAWLRLKEDGSAPLLALYAQRPGMLLRSLTRLVKSGIPADEIAQAVDASHAYSLPSLVRTLTIMSADDLAFTRLRKHPNEDEEAFKCRKQGQLEAYNQVAPIIHSMLERRLASIETPLRGQRVFVDIGPFSLDQSVLMPNDTGNTGTAYPPAGMAYTVPSGGTVRFFTFWDNRSGRVDVDLHFYARDINGIDIYHVGWNGDFRGMGMVTSGDITHSENAVEYLDVEMADARDSGIDSIQQVCRIYSGAENWADIETCFSGAMIVRAPGIELPLAEGAQSPIYQAKNVIFRDDMAGAGVNMTYAIIDVANSTVRLMRGANYPFVRSSFSLGSYIDLLIEAQGATVASSREEADVVLAVGRSEDENAICLIDEGFFLG